MQLQFLTILGMEILVSSQSCPQSIIKPAVQELNPFLTFEISSFPARALPIQASGNSSCDPFTRTPSWQYASDSQAASGGLENYPQCGLVRFYPTENNPRRSTGPYTITWLPSQGLPITVNVPRSFESENGRFFIYNSTVPFKAGTQFQIVAGDSTGGASGGASQLYTVQSSDDDSCLQSGYQLANLNMTAALSTGGSTVATFSNLAGAVDSANGDGTSGGGGSNVGAITGGVIVSINCVCGSPCNAEG